MIFWALWATYYFVPPIFYIGVSMRSSQSLFQDSVLGFRVSGLCQGSELGFLEFRLYGGLSLESLCFCTGLLSEVVWDSAGALQGLGIRSGAAMTEKE